MQALMQAVRYIGLYPSEELSTRLDAYQDPIKTLLRRHDLAKRITVLAVTLITVMSLVMMGLACNQMVHPMVGVGLFLGAICLSAVPCYLHHRQRLLLPPNDDLEELYHPPVPTPPSTPSSARSRSPALP